MTHTISCKVCGNSGNNKEFIAKEMMYGLRDQFAYCECGNCGCLQIAEIPANLAKYYPDDFYAYKSSPETEHPYQPPNPVRYILRRARTKQLLGHHTILGRLALRLTSDYFSDTYDWNWLRKTHTQLDSRILDVGCGTGTLLFALMDQGFSSLTGVDPFISNDISRGSVHIHKCTLSDLDGHFDLIMLHHSFEHMPSPSDALQNISRLLRPGGYALIRIPVADSYAWDTYRTNWVQLDAPRHLFLHTRKSMGILASTAGFEITGMDFDSTAFQFLGSEQYARNIPLRDPSSYSSGIEKSIFTQADLIEYKKKAIELNKREMGDQACFFLRKIHDTSQGKEAVSKSP